MKRCGCIEREEIEKAVNGDCLWMFGAGVGVINILSFFIYPSPSPGI